MNKEEIIQYENKKILVNLKTGFSYRGFIKKINDDSINFTDYLGNNLTISLDSIALIIESKNKRDEK